jgi:HD-GYP domain-containing protein (c-di-GMP phosphodiesterase class II)
LKVKDKPFGVLNLHLSGEKATFTDYDLKFLTLLADESAITLENIKLYESIENFYLEMVQTLARVIDVKDAYTGDHAGRARKKARRLAEELNMPEIMIRYVEYAALLHDIGKIGIEGPILSKPGKLTDEEFSEIKKHPSIGYQILSPVRFLGPVAQMVLYHQEWFNGNGYPEGLKGEEIPLGARIVATIDAWDAMRSDRPYRKALPREKAVEELKKGSGTQFDPKVVEVFLRLEEQEWKIENNR